MKESGAELSLANIQKELAGAISVPDTNLLSFGTDYHAFFPNAVKFIRVTLADTRFS